MKKAIFIPILMFLFSSNLFSQDSGNNSISLDPFTFLGLFVGSAFSPDYEYGSFLFGYLGLSVDVNWVTENRREAGAGIFVRGDRIALTAKYRSFYNKERQSGFFWGVFWLVEWRKMFWNNEDSKFTIGWAFPYLESNNVYHSIGVTGGGHIGFRFRMNDWAITPYVGAGLPLFYCFGDLPPDKVMGNFYAANMLLRAVSVGLKFDFFFRNDLNSRIL
jgi:hypothetical protein